jgi:hypothetical protein
MAFTFVRPWLQLASGLMHYGKKNAATSLISRDDVFQKSDRTVRGRIAV